MTEKRIELGKLALVFEARLHYWAVGVAVSKRGVWIDLLPFTFGVHYWG